MAKEQREVVSTESAIKLCGCSRSVFYAVHHPKLTPLKSKGRKVWFDYAAVKAYAESLQADVPNFKEVTI